jgi:hypothetical protein
MSRESIYDDEPEFTVLKMVDGRETWISLAQLAAELEAEKIEEAPIKKCPVCGSRMHKVILGAPNDDDLASPKDWVTFTGCIVGENTPEWICLKCEDADSGEFDPPADTGPDQLDD